MTGVPSYVEVQGAAVFTVLHRPAGPVLPTAVLLVAPFGYEDVASYRTRRQWADELAGQGRAVLRFDLPGSGDSAGGPFDPDVAVRWPAAVAQLSAHLRAATSCRRVAVVGLGLGGLLALAAVDAGAPVDDLVLWGAPGRGRTAVRQLRAFAALQAAPPDPEQDPGQLAAADPALWVNGYPLSEPSQAVLAGLDAAGLDLSAVRRALLLERDGLAVDALLRSSLAGAGVQVDVGPGAGYDLLVSTTGDTRLPADVVHRVGVWLAEGDRAAGGAPQPVLRPSGRVARTEGACERLVTVAGLEGVLVEGAGRPAGVTVVLLNAGGVRRTGPNRMWVDSGRRWAARGVRTLRLDLPGVGDSPGGQRGLGGELEFYDESLRGPLSAVLDELVGPTGGVVVGGLCSGAYWAFRLLQEDPRVQVALMLNPSTFQWEPELEDRRNSRGLRKLLRAATWRKAVRGQVSGAYALLAGRALLRRLLRLPAELTRARTLRRRRRALGGDAVDLALDSLRDAGKRLTVVLSDSEPLRDEWDAQGKLRRLDRWPNLDLHLVDSGSYAHLLSPVPVQRQVADLMDDVIEQCLSGGQVGVRSGDEVRARAGEPLG